MPRAVDRVAWMREVFLLERSPYAILVRPPKTLAEFNATVAAETLILHLIGESK